MLHQPSLVDDHGDPADHRRDEEPRHDALLRPEVEDPQPQGGFGGGRRDGRRHQPLALARGGDLDAGARHGAAQRAEVPLLNQVHHPRPINVHGENCQEEECLEEEVCEQPHHSEETKVPDGCVQNPEEEAESEDGDLGEEVLGDVPALVGQPLGNSDLDVEVLWRGHDGPGHHQHVLQPQRRQEEGDQVDVVAGTEAESRQPEGHQQRAEHCDDGRQGDPELGFDPIYLAEDVDADEEQEDGEGDILAEHLLEEDVDSVGDVVLLHLVQESPQAGHELRLVLPVHRRHVKVDDV